MMRSLNKKRNSSSRTRKYPHRSDAFTFVELVVALAIGATVIAVSVMAFSTINSQGLSRRQLTVDIGNQNAYAFYQWTDPRAAVSEAPSFAATAMANSLREEFLGDLASATAVVCLARNKPNSIRPTNIAIPGSLDARTLITPDNFRTNLIDPSGVVYTNFNANGNGSAAATNLSIYLLYARDDSTNVTVDAIYESDMVNIASPKGVYASVRRYVGTNMTSYYHVFYPDATNGTYQCPPAAFFTKANAALGLARYRQAENRPFYFVWWPDPSRRVVWWPNTNRMDLGTSYPPEATNSSSPRSDYMRQAGATSFFLCFPAFPPL